MEVTIEDYQIILTEYNEEFVEVQICRNKKCVTGLFTVSILKMSAEIRKVIISNEMKEFGYCRFNLER